MPDCSAQQAAYDAACINTNNKLFAKVAAEAAFNNAVMQQGAAAQALQQCLAGGGMEQEASASPRRARGH